MPAVDLLTAAEHRMRAGRGLVAGVRVAECGVEGERLAELVVEGFGLEGGALLEDGDGGDIGERLGGENVVFFQAAIGVGSAVGILGMTVMARRQPRRTFVASTVGCAAFLFLLGFTHVLLYSRLMPWDHAAGALIHREAGGYSAHFDGQPYLPTHFDGGLICSFGCGVGLGASTSVGRFSRRACCSSNW